MLDQLGVARAEGLGDRLLGLGQVLTGKLLLKQPGRIRFQYGQGVPLASLFDAPAILCGYSRLVVDCNRRLDDATLMPAVSDGSAVPGNRTLDASGREARLAAMGGVTHELQDVPDADAEHNTANFAVSANFANRFADTKHRDARQNHNAVGFSRKR